MTLIQRYYQLRFYGKSGHHNSRPLNISHPDSEAFAQGGGCWGCLAKICKTQKKAEYIHALFLIIRKMSLYSPDRKKHHTPNNIRHSLVWVWFALAPTTNYAPPHLSIVKDTQHLWGGAAEEDEVLHRLDEVPGGGAVRQRQAPDGKTVQLGGTRPSTVTWHMEGMDCRAFCGREFIAWIMQMVVYTIWNNHLTKKKQMNKTNKILSEPIINETLRLFWECLRRI